MTSLLRDAKPVIAIEHLSKWYGSDGQVFQALSDVNLEIHNGRFVSLVGPSGCGKSTLLNIIAGLLKPSEGRILYDGQDVKGPNTEAGYITQRDHLLPWRTVEKNIALALEIRHVPTLERTRRVDEILNRVGLSNFAQYYPAQLSGGMRKRASLAQTLVYGPHTLLMDEPFGAVDAFLRMSLHEMLLEIWERDRTTVVFVTHDLEEAILLSDEVVVMGTSPGRILLAEKVDFARPRNLLDLRSTPEFGHVWRRLWDYVGKGHEHTNPDMKGMRSEASVPDA
jgi:NitT/TauT family transport system ATP-binding protein